MIIYQNGNINCYCARRRLCDCGQIHHLIFFNPTKFLHEFLSHQRNDYKSTAKSASTQFKSGEKQFFLFLQAIHFKNAVLSMFINIIPLDF